MDILTFQPSLAEVGGVRARDHTRVCGRIGVPRQAQSAGWSALPPVLAGWAWGHRHCGRRSGDVRPCGWRGRRPRLCRGSGLGWGPALSGRSGSSPPCPCRAGRLSPSAAFAVVSSCAQELRQVAPGGGRDAAGPPSEPPPPSPCRPRAALGLLAAQARWPLVGGGLV